MRSVKILQLSDCHLSADPEADYRGQNADLNLQELLPRMRALNPDLILLTGDVSEDATPAAYARAAVMLRTVDAPLLVLPGNHDDPEEMRKHFPRGPWKGPYAEEMGPWLVTMMDSTVRGQISGSFSQHHLEQFDTCLRNSGAEFVLVALHHQPVPVNAPWIDRYALEEPDGFFGSIDRDPRVRCIAWGHVHQDFRSHRNGVVLMGAPSSAANSLPETDRFTFDVSGPACRWLVLGGDGSVETGLLRSEPVRPQSSTGKTSQRTR